MISNTNRLPALSYATLEKKFVKFSGTILIINTLARNFIESDSTIDRYVMQTITVASAITFLAKHMPHGTPIVLALSAIYLANEELLAVDMNSLLHGSSAALACYIGYTHRLSYTPII